jgi:hypothetical protein
MKPLIFILFLIISLASSGQIEKQINSTLMKRSFNAFLNFTRNYKTERNGIRISKGNIREITEGYQEAMFYVIKAYQVNKGVSIAVNLKIRILTHSDRIIYFYLESKEMKDFPNSLETTSDTTYSFVDKVNMRDLKKRFELEYKSSLNENDLFIDTIAVGTNCGRYPGSTIKQHEQMQKWVQANDTSSLFTWLQSANAEKQVFAVKGLYYLSLSGTMISDEKKAIARRVRQKKGTIYTCIPCDTSERLISKELEDFLL